MLLCLVPDKSPAQGGREFATMIRLGPVHRIRYGCSGGLGPGRQFTDAISYLPLDLLVFVIATPGFHRHALAGLAHLLVTAEQSQFDRSRDMPGVPACPGPVYS